MLLEPRRRLPGEPGTGGPANPGQKVLDEPRGFRPSSRWLMTALDGLSCEARTRVAGHLSEEKKKRWQ